jgi:hypothetical protein
VLRTDATPLRVVRLWGTFKCGRIWYADVKVEYEPPTTYAPN